MRFDSFPFPLLPRPGICNVTVIVTRLVDQPAREKHNKSLTFYYISKALASAQPRGFDALLIGLIKALLSPFAC